MNWRQEAACKDEDPELFFPVGKSGPARQQAEMAKTVCRRCIVANECLKSALEDDQGVVGVWGGMSEQEREQAIRVLRRSGILIDNILQADIPDPDSMNLIRVAGGAQPISTHEKTLPLTSSTRKIGALAIQQNNRGGR